MSERRVWRNVFKKRVFVSTLGECIVTEQPIAKTIDVFSDNELQSVPFYVVKPSSNLKYTIYFDTEREFTADAWAFVAYASGLTAIDTTAPEASFDTEHVLSLNNLVAATDKRTKAHFNLAHIAGQYGVDVETYINDLISGLLSYGGCRGVYTKELVQSGGIIPFGATQVERVEFRYCVLNYTQKRKLNFTARSTYTVLNLNNCTITQYGANSLYQLLMKAGGSCTEFQLYGGSAHYVWLDVDRTLSQED